MHVEMCVFWDGHHVYAAPNCPHGRTEDEMGPIQPPGWTVQNRNNNQPEKDDQHV